ncbi:MAG: molybdenum cofactor guanylyltransferase [Deltaproteobacteria bacterium]|nr:molybdenum cofactor guanylyltransferase [Deltaproteobacteria bacterium]
MGAAVLARKGYAPEVGTVAGIFVGGQSRRMGGFPKGLLHGVDGRPLVERLGAVLGGLGAEVWRVGAHPAYGHLAWPLVEDRPPEVGPLGGLAGLLWSAQEAGFARVLVVACDLPRVGEGLLRRLLEERPEALVLAPRRERWEPLCARYSVATLPAVEARLARGAHGLQGLLAEVGAEALALTDEEARGLEDWDRPEDVGR